MDSKPVSRRSSLPPQRISITEKPPAESSVISTEKSPLEKRNSRRASIGSGMLSAPFKHTPKEAPRWRPASFRAQFGIRVGNGDNQEEKDRFSAEDSLKHINQRILEKTGVSIVLGWFICFLSFAFGLFTRLITRHDLGLLGFWVNQLLLIIFFSIDKRPGTENEKRMEKFTAFEFLTLACQILPLLWTLLFSDPFSYSKLSLMILYQAALKLFLMKSMGSLVDIAL